MCGLREPSAQQAAGRARSAAREQENPELGSLPEGAAAHPLARTPKERLGL